MPRFESGRSGNPLGRTPGSFNPSTFVKRELFTPNKDKIKEVVLMTLDKAKDGTGWAAKLIFEYFIGKQTDLDDDNVQALVEDKLKELSKERLEQIQREVFEAMQPKQLEENKEKS